MEVLVKMPVDVRNEEAIKRYKVLVSQNYKEPVNGSFEDITDVILQLLGGESSDLETEDDSDDGARDA